MVNFMISLNVILPIFLMMIMGVIIKKVGLISDSSVKSMNKIIAQVFLPFLVFLNIYNVRTEDVFSSETAWFCLAGILIEFGLAFGFAGIITKDNNKRGVMIQGMFRSNYVIFGVPIAAALYGASGSSATSMLTMTVIPCFNVLAVVALESFSSSKTSIFRILYRLITNPLIIASAAGLLLPKLNIELPELILKPLSSIASCATPMAFVFLGASLTVKSLKSHLKELLSIILTRLILFPAIFIAAAVALGFRDVWLVVILTVFASPTAVSSFSLVQSIGGDDNLAGNTVVFTSVLSVLTMFMWIFMLKSLCLI